MNQTNLDEITDSGVIAKMIILEQRAANITQQNLQNLHLRFEQLEREEQEAEMAKERADQFGPVVLDTSITPPK